MAVSLRNPHSVLAVLETRPQAVAEIRLYGPQASGAWDEVVKRAGEHRIPVRRGVGGRDKGRRNRRDQLDQSGRSGSAEATVKERGDVSLDELFAQASGRAGGRGLWLALDRIQDPQNVGAIFRSAAFFGVQGIVVSRDRSAPLNAAVYDVASGGIEYVPFSVQTNLSRAMAQAKNAGLWVLGTSERAETELAQIDRGRPWLLVLGNEEQGLRRLTLETCDSICRLSPRGAIASLNVSVAAGILMAALTSSA